MLFQMLESLGRCVAVDEQNGGSHGGLRRGVHVEDQVRARPASVALHRDRLHAVHVEQHALAPHGVLHGVLL
jgi:hypothetical protein